MQRARWTIVAILAPLAIGLATLAIWALDVGAAGGQVLRNTELAGEAIGGLGTDQLLERISDLDARLTDRPIRIRTPEITYDTTAAEIGLTIDVSRTADRAFDEGRTAFLALRPLQWVASFLRPQSVPLRYTVDIETARATLRRLEGSALVSPKEPTIEIGDDGEFVPVPGEPGTGIDPRALSIALAAAASDTSFDDRVVVDIDQTVLAPRLGAAIATDAARRANALTSRPMVVTSSRATAQLSTADLRDLVVLRELEDGLDVTLDREALQERLADRFADFLEEPRNARFTVEGDEVRLTPDIPGTTCCSPETVQPVIDAFESGFDRADVELDPAEAEFTTADAEALGIVEEIGDPTAFGPTTHHACCQNRVTNIQRMADLVRGAIILPGETLSINSYVGRRTIQKGFKTDGAIYNGVLTTDVGGGVSQFATSLFNAALFAGLEFGEYQSHSLYISRYPKGHEATISFPAPDLQVHNPTPYAVLVWPEYTPTSITVRLFSTRSMEVEVGTPTPSPQGNCTRWTTPRTRTYEDGSTVRDSVFAVYRPAEGVNCYPVITPDEEPSDGEDGGDGDAEDVDDQQGAAGQT